MTIKQNRKQKLRKETPRPASPVVDYLIIGNGVAGMNCALSIRQHDREGTLTILTHEPVPFYSRPLIVDVMTGKKRKEDIILVQDEEYKRNRITLLKDVRVEKLDRKTRSVRTQEGVFFYKKLLIATGAEPKTIPLTGTGIFSLRTIQDAEVIARYLKHVKRAIVYGGGPVGIKAAYALLTAGIPVSIIVTSPHILSRVLDETVAIRFQKLFESHGATFYLQREIEDREGRSALKGVITDRGERIPGDILIVGKGVEPDLALIRDTEIKAGKGIVVNDKMETNCENIYAAGDVAEAPLSAHHYPLTTSLSPLTNQVISLWHVGASQGRVAGTNMAGSTCVYEGGVGSNSIEYFGLKCISMGTLKDTGTEEITIEENSVYRKYIFQEERLIGAVLLDDVTDAGTLLHAIRKGLPVKSHLLRHPLTPYPLRGTESISMEVLF